MDVRIQAQRLKRAGRYSEAETLAREALATLNPEDAAGFELQSDLLNELADVFLHRGMHLGAEDTFQRALVSLEKACELRGAQDGVRKARLLHNLGASFLYRDAGDEALPLLKQALSLREQELGVTHPQVAESLDALGMVMMGKGLLDAAEELQRRSVSIYKEREAENPVDYALALGNWAETLGIQGKHERALELFYQSADVLKRLGSEHSAYLNALSNVASALFRLGRVEEAHEMSQHVLHVRERRLGASHPDTLLSMKNCATALKQLGRIDEANAMVMRLKQAQPPAR